MDILKRQLHLHSGDTHCVARNGAIGKYAARIYLQWGVRNRTTLSSGATFRSEIGN